MHRAHMLNVHRARLLAASRAAPNDDEDLRLCYTIVACGLSLMLLGGLLSVVPSPRAFAVTKACVIIAAAAVVLVLMLLAWLVAPGAGALAARQLARHLCACGLAGAAVGALPAFAYEPPAAAAASEGGEPASRGSCALRAVCLEDVRAGEMVRQLPACRHLFHADCVDAWLRSHRTCPLCRREVLPRTVTAKAAVTVPSPSPDALPPV